MTRLTQSLRPLVRQRSSRGHPEEPKPSWSARHDAGSAIVETIFAVLVIVVPLIWIALALLRVEAASYAVRSAAREAARTYVTAETSAEGAARSQAAALIAFDDQRAPRGRVALTCSAQPCLTPGASVRAHAQTDVPLPFVPSWLAGPTGLRIHVQAQHSETVERYGGTR